eukprot:CAMPEP_0175337966 /NCGR_PEP_ID=MMETSP0095-20121207/4597_1 /TAXON_ID=311494 /ORGANISM="Alexandrium monilatum, Strain CCMP3105" /LENGTH=310 /DNA_ID=CAMNT_0016635365 /DNA_START=30 /DNA_END=961 /DNA_ORIENTATION=-
METMQSRRQLLPIMAVWMPAVTASAAGPADAVVSLSALGVNPCIEPATSGCVFGTAEPAQETTSTSPQPPPYRLIRANGSEHIYFQTIGEPRKHLVRKGLCHICGRPEVCGAVVEVDASYVDGLESETDFDCDMLDAVGVRRNTSAAGGGARGPSRQAEAPAPLGGRGRHSALLALLLHHVVLRPPEEVRGQAQEEEGCPRRPGGARGVLAGASAPWALPGPDDCTGGPGAVPHGARDNGSAIGSARQLACDSYDAGRGADDEVVAQPRMRPFPEVPSRSCRLSRVRVLSERSRASLIVSGASDIPAPPA